MKWNITLTISRVSLKKYSFPLLISSFIACIFLFNPKSDTPRVFSKLKIKTSKTWMLFAFTSPLFNPWIIGLQGQFCKIFSSIAAHRSIQTEWKFVGMIICSYRSDCNRKFQKFLLISRDKGFPGVSLIFEKFQKLIFQT